MATDLAEFVGAALALNLVFGVPMLLAGMITDMVAFSSCSASKCADTGLSSEPSQPRC